MKHVVTLFVALSSPWYSNYIRDIKDRIYNLRPTLSLNADYS